MAQKMLIYVNKNVIEFDKNLPALQTLTKSDDHILSSEYSDLKKIGKGNFSSVVTAVLRLFELHMVTCKSEN